MGQLNERYCQEQKHQKLEMSNLQQVSDNGKNACVTHVGVIESQFHEDMSSQAKLNDQMEGILQQWYRSHFTSNNVQFESAVHS